MVYTNDIKSCNNCFKEIPSKNKNFCSQKCFGIYSSLKYKSLRPNCKVCGEKTNGTRYKHCSRNCMMIGSRKESKRCIICNKDIICMSQFCISCRDKKFTKIYMNFDLIKFREYIKTKNYCLVHLTFYNDDDFCKQCYSIDKIRNIRRCLCGHMIKKSSTLCRECLNKKFKSKEYKNKIHIHYHSELKL